jgi:hypothetical protein
VSEVCDRLFREEVNCCGRPDSNRSKPKAHFNYPTDLSVVVVVVVAAASAAAAAAVATDVVMHH